MDIDEEVVELSLRNARVPEIARRSPVCSPVPTRCLRPRTELKSSVEAPDVDPVVVEEPRTNVFTSGFSLDLHDVDLPVNPLPIIKEFTEKEVGSREESIRRLRTELRNEEMVLVMLKKIQQSYQMKENVGIVNPCTTVPSNVVPTTTMNNAGIVSTTGPQIPPQGIPVRQVTSRSGCKPPPAQPPVYHLLITPAMNLSGVPIFHVPPLILPKPGITPGIPPLASANLHQPTANMSRSTKNVSARGLGQNFAAERKDARHSPVPRQKKQSRTGPKRRGQTRAQRQAAAKLALRKQLEKTPLQIPPPIPPPPPEMHFIPNTSNKEFTYLVGLEQVVDYITKDSRSPPPPKPFRCSQCSTNFTPVWKWEKGSIKGKEPKVICEQCVSSKMMKALKAKQLKRLQTAFAKALQKGQQSEQRLAQGSPGPDNIVGMGPGGTTVPGTSGATSISAIGGVIPSTASVEQQSGDAAGIANIVGGNAATGSCNRIVPNVGGNTSAGLCSTPNPIMTQGGTTLVLGGSTTPGVNVVVPPQATASSQQQPQPPPPATPKPSPQPQTSSTYHDHLAKLADAAKFNPHHAAAAIHHQG